MNSSLRAQARFRAGFILLALTFCLARSAGAQGRAECRDAPSKILGHTVPYCVILPPSYDASKTSRYPVLYFLHGLGGNAETLIDSGGLDMIEDLWQRKQIGEFLIVTPNAGRSFYINSRDGRVRYQDFFIREFLPYIEMHYRILRDPKHRGISGVSMGGYGALRFAFLYPGLFGSVSAHSPALVENPPRARVSNMQEMAITRFLGSAFGVPFDPDYWNRESPFTIVRERPRPRDLRIYFDCGTSDDYGFNRGAEAFHKLLVARGIPHEFHLYPGGHDWQYFAQHLPASFEFHSRVFFP
jgi:S-formylglutathione hydrolase FrmB